MHVPHVRIEKPLHVCAAAFTAAAAGKARGCVPQGNRVCTAKQAQFNSKPPAGMSRQGRRALPWEATEPRLLALSRLLMLGGVRAA